MKILGMKYTHDSAIAVIEGDRLLFSIEGEKISNGNRHKTADDAHFVTRVLESESMSIDEIDAIALDGWAKTSSTLNKCGLKANSYSCADVDMLTPKMSITPFLSRDYMSFTHSTDHIMGAYASSPWARGRQMAACVFWDGGQIPTAYIINPNSDIKIRHVGNIMVLRGGIYGIMGLYAGPFKDEKIISGKLISTIENPILAHMSIPGKLMSYIATGKVSQRLLSRCFDAYNEIEIFIYKSKINLLLPENRVFQEHEFMRRVMYYAQLYEESDSDVLATIHQFLETKFVSKVKEILPYGIPLIFTGGSALNIKWNTALIESWHFSEIWVPPFPNDCGCAIGAAASANAYLNNIWHFEWSVYSGPKLIDDGNFKPDNWTGEQMSPIELGKFLFSKKEAVVALHGRSEIGPRALGHRSLFMSPETTVAKDTLNQAKMRESWRPVAPICLLEDARLAFHLMCEDKFMLYDHKIKCKWVNKIPAIKHIDDTARVQTVTEGDSKFVFDVLSGFKSLSSYGILCNTSANYNGKGFFPDVTSAMNWCDGNSVNYVWANGTLYSKIRS